LDFYYDAQIRRYLVQFMRIFTDVKHETDPDENGIKAQKRIPVVYGDPSWQVAQIMRGQSQNTLVPVPMMAAWIVGIELAPERRKDPAFEGIVQGMERQFIDGAYTDEPGNRFTIERYMPVPYKLTMQLDIWTSNTMTKLQILEQIMTVFNPSLQLQQNSNTFDWSSLFEVELKSVNWTNRTVPQGGSDDRDVASLTFDLDIWMNPPTKIKKQTIIEQIVVNVNSVADISDLTINSQIEDPLASLRTQEGQIIVSPGDFKVSIGNDPEYADNELVLLTKHGVADPTLSWGDLFNSYGRIEADSSRVRLKLDDNIELSENDVIGTVALHGTKPNVLVYTIDSDTLPATTLSEVDQIIDPTKKWPGNNLPVAATGQRYLLVSSNSNNEESAIPEDTAHWSNITANRNDIIEYNGANWVVSFDSINETEVQYVELQGNHYKFAEGEWTFTYFGEYAQGYWRIENLNSSSETSAEDYLNNG